MDEAESGESVCSPKRVSKGTTCLQYKHRGGIIDRTFIHNMGRLSLLDALNLSSEYFSKIYPTL